MEREDRMTIDLLNNYAFVLHENISDLSDEEINVARNFATDYLKKDWKWKNYNLDFNMFVNRQKFKAITNNDYESIEKIIYQMIKDMTDMINTDDWNYDIYYSVDHDNKIFLSRTNQDKTYEKIDLDYDIIERKISLCNVPISREMDKLGNINNNSYSLYELCEVKI